MTFKFDEINHCFDRLIQQGLRPTVRTFETCNSLNGYRDSDLSFSGAECASAIVDATPASIPAVTCEAKTIGPELSSSSSDSPLEVPCFLMFSITLDTKTTEIL